MRETISTGVELLQLVPIDLAMEEAAYGRKAVRLGAAAQVGLPVPPTFALSTRLAAAGARRGEGGGGGLRRAVAALGSPAAGRGSMGERVDARPAVVNVRTAAAAVEVIERMVVAATVWAGSAAVLVQRYIAAEVSGRLIHRNGERIVEAWWGLSRPVGDMS